MFEELFAFYDDVEYYLINTWQSDWLYFGVYICLTLYICISGASRTFFPMKISLLRLGSSRESARRWNARILRWL